ncbi:ImpA family type VI secretion system protein [Klebsiella pneumoniae]|uniref:type VI secretion system protein TssA n=1 Tax=Klebsiella pneumoniae TaxID=573 RepID=UPI00224BA3FC|nr:type VI secretion system ImpA family N-terminal domain-containing protein [Klebsiella pneumoniae]
MTMIFSVSARRSIRISGVDTVLICQLAGQLLATTKDIRIVTYYCWARLHQDGEAGLADGLELLAGLLQRYGMQLYPQRDRSRKAALEWLAGTRILDSLSLFSRSCAGGRKAYRRRAASH